MNKIYIPEGYQPSLDAYDTQRAIAYIKETFQEEFAKALNLKRVSAPLFVDPTTGLNDDLSGVERAVRFDIKELNRDAEIVHSLAKWKRTALKKYGAYIMSGEESKKLAGILFKILFFKFFLFVFHIASNRFCILR